MKTQVALTFGGKELDCEVEVRTLVGVGGLNDLEYTLVKVEMVGEVERNTIYSRTHIEDITEFLECVLEPTVRDYLENLCIEAIQERGYV